jgi:hypothetical protein
MCHSDNSDPNGMQTYQQVTGNHSEPVEGNCKHLHCSFYILIDIIPTYRLKASSLSLSAKK